MAATDTEMCRVHSGAAGLWSGVGLVVVVVGGDISAVVLEVHCSHYVTGCEAWWACGGVSGSAPHGGGRKGLE